MRRLFVIATIVVCAALRGGATSIIPDFTAPQHLYLAWKNSLSQYDKCGFYTERLSNIAKAVGMGTASTSQSYYTDTAWTYNGRALRVRINGYGDVSHIGYRLFNDDIIKANGNEALFNFLERYLLELDLRLDGRTPAQRMDVDRFQIAEGTYQMLRSVGESTPFSIDEVKRRLYKITWTVGGRQLVVSFQADAQLMLGANDIELEHIASRYIPCFTQDYFSLFQKTKNGITGVLMYSGTEAVVSPKHTSDLLEKCLAPWKNAKLSSADGLQVFDNGNWLSQQICSKIYLRVSNGTRSLLCDYLSPSKSVTNIMLTGYSKMDIPMTLVVDKYGHKRDTIETSVMRLVNFFREDGCQVYAGIKSIHDNTVYGTLFVLNEHLAYNHVVPFEFPIEQLAYDDSKMHVTGRLLAYIPLQNMSEKYFNQYLTDKNSKR